MSRELWEKVQAQQAANRKLQGKYETVKGDLRVRQERADFYRAALVSAANLCGPPDRCPDNECVGCAVYQSETSHVLFAALGYEDWQTFHDTEILGSGRTVAKTVTGATPARPGPADLDGAPAMTCVSRAAGDEREPRGLPGAADLPRLKPEPGATLSKKENR